MTSLHAPDRLLELLADRATDGLRTDGERELAQLLEDHPGVDADMLDDAAAAVFLAHAASEDQQELPADMRDRLSDLAGIWCRGDVSVALVEGSNEVPAVIGKLGVRGWLGWVAAAAALLFAAVVVWQRPPSASGPALAGVQRELEALRADPAAVRIPFSPGPDETGAKVAGEVVWSDSEQRGFMIFRGLRPLDASRNVYQLWIFDPQRDDRFPVHGGVFAGADGEAEYIVPIEPHLGVDKPRFFVVTVEPPGGVWVSDRSRIAAVAKAG